MDYKYILRILGYAIVVIVLLVMIGLIFYHVVASNVLTIEAAELKSGSLDLYVESSATLIRDETVIPMPEGFAIYAAGDGERIAAGTPVASIYEDSDDVRDIASQIAEIDVQLDILESVRNLESSYTLSTVDKRLAEVGAALSESSAAADVKRTAELSREYSILLDIRKLKSGHKADFKSEIKSLTERRNELTESLGIPKKTVVTDTPGYLYSVCDGYENIYGSALVAGMNGKEIEALSEKPAEDLSKSVKLVTDHKWYLLAPVDADRLVYFTEGSKYDVEIGGERISMRLERVIRDGGADGRYLVLSDDHIPGQAVLSRINDVKIIYKTESGYIIPVKALRECDGYNGVYVLHGSVIKFRRIQILAMNDVYTVCDKNYSVSGGKYQTLKINDRIITKGEGLKDGRIAD